MGVQQQQVGCFEQMAAAMPRAGGGSRRPVLSHDFIQPGAWDWDRSMALVQRVQVQTFDRLIESLAV